MRTFIITLLVSFLLWFSFSDKTQTNNFVKNNSHELKPAAAYERHDFFLKKRLADGQDRLPMNVYADAQNIIKQRDLFSTKSSKNIPSTSTKQVKSETAWQWMGPGNIGGRTRFMVFNPNDNDMMYAGGVSGGIWKSTNAGANWHAIADNMANINIGAIAIDATHVDTLYVGTGELYRKTNRPYSSMSGSGIFKTIDGGETWLQLDATNNDNFMYVSDILISPNNHKRIYAATNTGVWRSDNGGISFIQTLFPNDGMGNSLYEGCNDLSIRNDKTDDWVLVSCASRSTDDRYYLPGLLPDACNGDPCDARIYVNTQAQVSDDWEVVLTEPGMGRTQMSIHKANQDIIYASSANTDGGPDLNGDFFPDLHNGLHAIFKSIDGGLTWQATLRNTDSTILNTQLFSYAEGALNSYCGGTNWYYSAGWYNQAIAVSPTNPNEVWVAGMEIYRSDDSGQNFGMASHWDAIYYGNPAVEGAYVHADQHSIIFHPQYNGTTNKKMFATNDGGIYYTNDNSQRVLYSNDAACSQPPTDGVKWDNLNNNYGVTQFYTGDVSADGSFFIAGAQDNGTNLGSLSTGANNWYGILGGDGSELAINPQNSNILYASSQNANLARSLDKGETWHRATNGLFGNFIFISPFKLDHNNPSRLYMGGQYLWQSTNRGFNWFRVSPNLGNNYNDLISAIAIAPSNSQHILYANKYRIYKNIDILSDDPESLQTSSSPREGWVSSLAIDPQNENTAYVSYSTFGGTHVWKSIDGGSSWQELDGQSDGKLPDIPVHSIVVDPNNSQRLYIGTDLGVFVTVDGGEHWFVENTGFSQVITERLVISTPQDDSTPYLFAFTYGRGVWRVPLSELDAQPDFEISSDISGLWYNPQQPGHGLQIEIIQQNNSDDKLYVSWYTHLNNEPVWLTGIGEITNNKSTIGVVITSGNDFPMNGFDPKNIDKIIWGQLNLNFSSNNYGQLSWSSQLPRFNNGSISIKKLTSIAENNNTAGINACHSGTWYNSDQSGHGFMLEVIGTAEEQRMVLTWFTYHNGKQYWILAAGDVNGNEAVLDASISSGSSFPPDFDSIDITTTVWGTITFNKIDDDNAIISWQPLLDGFAPDTIDVSRITQLSAHSCK